MGAVPTYPTYPTYSALSHLDCPRCGARHDATVRQGVCPACGSPLLARYDLGAVTTTRDEVAARAPDLWRYHELLPVRRPSTSSPSARA